MVSLLSKQWVLHISLVGCRILAGHCTSPVRAPCQPGKLLLGTQPAGLSSENSVFKSLQAGTLSGVNMSALLARVDSMGASQAQSSITGESESSVIHHNADT